MRSFWNLLRSLVPTAQTTRQLHLSRTNRIRPTLQVLEDRFAPATLYVDIDAVAASPGADVWDTTGGDHSPMTVSTLTFGADLFTSIQAAVDVAGVGDTILVADGTYTETVTISTSGLILNGNFFLTAGNGGGRMTNESIVDGASGGFIIDAQNVTVSGFTVTGQMDFMGTAGVTIQDSGATVENNIISNNIMGVAVVNPGMTTTGTTIQNNLIVDNNGFKAAPFDGAFGILLQTSTSGSTIQSNVINGHDADGILLTGNNGVTHTNETITMNSVTTMDGVGITIINTSNSVVTSNTIVGSLFEGIRFLGGNDGITVSGNTVSGAEDDGILILESATFENNGPNSNFNLSGNVIEIDIDMLFMPPDPNFAGISINSLQGNSMISGNTVNFDNTGASTTSVAGVRVDGDSNGDVLITMNEVTNTGTVTSSTGILVTDMGSATIGTGNMISGAPTAINLSGGASVQFDGTNTITGGDNGLVIDGMGTEVVGGTVANMEFSGQSGDYIALENMALQGEALSIVDASFEGTPTTELTPEELEMVSMQISDSGSNSGSGTIIITPPPPPGSTVAAAVDLNGNLQVVGSDNNESFFINAFNPGSVTVTNFGSPLGTFDLSGGGRIIVNALGGNDFIQVPGFLKTEIYGGDGNDVILGSSADDIIFGNAGDDRIYGNPGNDVLIGGAGRDFVYATSGINILVGGEVDDSANSFSNLDSVRMAWVSGTSPVSLAMTPPTTDPAGFADQDFLFGGSGADAFIFRMGGDFVLGFMAGMDEMLMLP